MLHCLREGGLGGGKMEAAGLENWGASPNQKRGQIWEVGTVPWGDLGQEWPSGTLLVTQV